MTLFSFIFLSGIHCVAQSADLQQAVLPFPVLRMILVCLNQLRADCYQINPRPDNKYR